MWKCKVKCSEFEKYYYTYNIWGQSRVKFDRHDKNIHPIRGFIQEYNFDMFFIHLIL